MTNRLLFSTPGEDGSVWETFAAELLRHNGHPKAIQYAAVDMSAAYTNGVSDNLGNPRVVYYKSHVIQNVVEESDQVRKVESRADGGKRDLLERTRWMWLKNRANWTAQEAQMWELVALERCVMGMAYKMSLVLQIIYKRKDASEAKKLFRNWFNWVHAIRGLTTAFMEGLNSLFSAVKRKARGYQTLEYMSAMQYFVAGKLTPPCY